MTGFAPLSETPLASLPAAQSTANGATLTATVSLIDGAATGSASASGATLTATASLISGAATGGASASGSTLSAVVSLISGAADGGVSVEVVSQPLRGGGPPVVSEKSRERRERKRRKERERLDEIVRAAYAQATGLTVEAVTEVEKPTAVAVVKPISARAKEQLARSILVEVRDDMRVELREIRAAIAEIERRLIAEAAAEDDDETFFLMAA